MDAMRRPQNIGRAELEILHFVQDHPPVTVREVADYFAQTKGHVRTTILNVMERLRKKGHLSRKKINGVFHYQPSVSKAHLLHALVHDFVEKTLRGSVSPFLAYLVQEGRISDEELRDLKQLVRDLDEQHRQEKGKR